MEYIPIKSLRDSVPWVWRIGIVLLLALPISCAKVVKECSGTEDLSGQARQSDKAEGRSSGNHSFFVENQGQFPDQNVKFYTKYQGRVVTFGNGEVHFVSPEMFENNEQGEALLLHIKDERNPVDPVPQGRRQSFSNFYRSSDIGRWHQAVPHYDRLLFPEVYPGIDVVYFFDSRRRLTFEYHVHPGGDPGQIRIQYSGVDGMGLNSEGMIVAEGKVGSLIMGQPLTYQIVGSAQQNVRSAHFLASPHLVAFNFPDGYDQNHELVIDPTLVFSTYWGSGKATNRTVSVDPHGNVFIAGGTRDSNWPSTLGRPHCGEFDVTVAKFDPKGNLLWSTLLGGPFEDYAYVSAVSDKGELYLSGRAGEGYPTTPGAFDRTFNGGIGGGGHLPTDAFVTKLSPDGRIVYSTYIGGNGDDNGRAIHLLPSGKLIVGGGNSISDDLPTDKGTIPGPVLKPNKGGLKDGWVAIVATDGASLDFCTYFGPDDDNNRRGDETIRALGVDNDGNIWIGGTTQAIGMTPSPTAFQKVRGQNSHSEAFVAKISRDGKSLLYFSWMGGDGPDEIETEGVSDHSGNFYVAGSTGSTDFPTTPEAFQRTLLGGNGYQFADGWVAKINNDGSLGFATLYGGSEEGPEGFFGPVIDSQGNVYVSGRFRSADLPTTDDAFQPQFGGKMDAILSVFSPTGEELLYSTYIGGSGTDQARHLGISTHDNAVYIVGETGSEDFPIIKGIPNSVPTAFFVKFTFEDDLTRETNTTGLSEASSIRDKNIAK